MITKFDRDNLKKLETEAIAALSALSAATGVKFRFGGGRFLETSATLKLEAYIPGETGETPERVAFRAIAKLYGFESTDLDKYFSVGGTQYKIIGWRSKGRSAKRLIASAPNGKHYVFLHTDVLRYLGRAIPSY